MKSLFEAYNGLKCGLLLAPLALLLLYGFMISIRTEGHETLWWSRDRLWPYTNITFTYGLQ